MSPFDRKNLLSRGAVFALVLGLWFSPVPEGLAPEAWHLFALFIAAIAAVVIDAFPILTASVLAVAAAVLTGVLPPAKAYSGFANGTILLVVVAFLVARSVVKCGLGARAGHFVVSIFGRSAIGLSYSILLVDALIAPAFPSNTARSGVIYPLAFSLAEAAGARRIEMPLREGDSVASVRDRLVPAHPALERFVPNLLYALDEEYADEFSPVPSGSTLALIPPVSGG